MNDRAAELAEHRALAAWRDEQRLLAALCAYVVARAVRCTHCSDVALWRLSTRPRSGFPSDEFQCDAHRRDGAVALPGADVLRRVLERMKKR